jgi:methionyl-tRNA formyltransferase
MNSPFVFFGTPRFSVRVLDALEAHGLTPALIITAPDRPAGRGQEMKPSPVKEWALARGIDVETPEKIKDGVLAGELRNSQWSFFVVAAYGKIIPKDILDIPQNGTLNVHPSLLPKFRGPSPVLSALLADQREGGVSVMLLDEEMDHGPILAQASIDIAPEDWPMKGSILEDLFATEGGNVLAETIPEWVKGSIEPVVQNHDEATYTRKWTDADAKLDIEKGDARANLLKIRAFDKNPRAYFLDLNGKRVIVTDAEIIDGKLQIISVIPEGKKEISYETFMQTQK